MAPDTDNYTDLSRFFAPRSVAIVGATDDTKRFGGRLLRQMLAFGSTARILPVNPNRREVQGLPCYPSVRELPETPDHVGLVIPAEKVQAILQECHERGVRFATVFTAGFSETGTERGRELQRELVDLARASGMRIMGPNCNGFINYVDSFALTATGTISGPKAPAGNIGVVSQSGGLGQVNVTWRAQQAGLGISYQVSCGNGADLDPLDFARFMVDSAATDVVLLALEGVSDGGKLMRLAEIAAQREKPLVVLKFGRTESGSRAAASHTGAMTGSDEVFDAAFRQFGLIRVDDCHELYHMAIALRSKRWPRGRRVASMSQSGGNVVQMADVGASLDLEWSEYSDSTQQRIAERIPGYGKVGNPTDMTSMVTGQMALYRQALEIITEDDNVDVMVPVFTMANRGELDHAVELAKASAKPVVILWTGGCLDQPDLLVDDLVRAGAPAFRDTLMCLQAVHAAIGYRAFLDRRARRGTPERPSNMDASAARALIAAAPGGTLTERLSKQVLAVYGVPVTGEKLARNADEAVTHARALGLPVALKVESADIAHKTEAGAIRLGLRDDAQIRQAFDDIVAAAQRYKPGAHIDGVLVQQMAAAGTEMIVGIADDPVFGPVIAAGLGGIHVEVLRDVAYRIPPIDAEEALSMLHELRAFRLLEGVRGQAPRDLGALSQAIERISWLAHELRDVVAELDVNPLMAFERGVLAVDALLIKKELP